MAARIDLALSTSRDSHSASGWIRTRQNGGHGLEREGDAGQHSRLYEMYGALNITVRGQIIPVLTPNQNIRTYSPTQPEPPRPLKVPSNRPQPTPPSASYRSHSSLDRLSPDKLPILPYRGKRPRTRQERRDPHIPHNLAPRRISPAGIFQT